MAGLRNLISLRMRLVFLVLLILVACAGSVVMVSLSMFVDDKSSYFMDYSLSQARIASGSVDHQIQGAIRLAKEIHRIPKSSRVAEIHNIFLEVSKHNRITKLAVLELGKNGTLNPEAIEGDPDKALVHTLDQLGWDATRFFSDQVLYGKTTSGLAVGVFVPSGDGSGTAVVFVMTPNLAPSRISSEFRLFLVDSMGELILTTGTGQSPLGSGDTVEIIKPILNGKTASGGQRWSSGSDSYLVTYQQLNAKELTVICLIPEKSVFSTLKGFILRSVSLAFSFVLIALGLILISMKRVTETLTSLISMTDKVREGDFSYRIETRAASNTANDEVETLASSFNLMVAKIASWVGEASSRFELQNQQAVSEIKVNQLIQKRALNSSQIGFFAQSFYAKQVDGDWWRYEISGDYTIIVVGKVNARGMDAVVSISALQGVLSTYSATVQASPTVSPDLKYIISQLNHALFDLGAGKRQFSGWIGIMDSGTGVLEMANFGQDVASFRALQPLRFKKRSPLGAQRSVKGELETVQLSPGEVLFWYTPGLMNVSNSQGERLNSEKLLGMVTELTSQPDLQAAEIATEMFSQLLDFFGEESHMPSEDITWAVATVPKKAKFVDPLDIGVA